jgi:hypothetical protein
MPRFIQLALEKRGVVCVARLLDADAPRTCQAVWDALPLGGDAFHAKYARNEVYTLLPPFTTREPGLENPTITPIPGDVLYFHLSGWQLSPGSHGYAATPEETQSSAMVDLALFYARNNLLLNPDYGFVPGSVFATIVEGLDAIATAANDLWRSGSVGERLTFTRLDLS